MEDPETAKPAAAVPSESSDPSQNLNDARYSFDQAKLDALCKEKPWMKEPKYFTKVALSPSAVMKMMMHCASGVKKGISKGGNPIEVMGLLLGRPDPITPKTLIVTDAFPLPIEGFETRVIADDQAVVNHMISLNECLERSRKEKFMGWYHSHPFDLGDHSHCFLSQTDLSTQLQWQRAEDPHGNPFVAIVIDPLRSSHLQTPELKAFRAYPPEYAPPNNTCPDGSVEEVEQVRLEHWGSCWNRYYELGVQYYMSSTSRHVLEQLTKDYMWMRNLQNRSDDKQKKEKIEAVTKELKGAGAALGESAGSVQWPTRSRARDPSSATMAAPGPRGSGISTSAVKTKTKNFNKAVRKVIDVASAELVENSLSTTKEKVFH